MPHRRCVSAIGGLFATGEIAVRCLVVADEYRIG
jgi:hypothetical protein